MLSEVIGGLLSCTERSILRNATSLYHISVMIQEIAVLACLKYFP